jgi:hypothetical protein
MSGWLIENNTVGGVLSRVQRRCHFWSMLLRLIWGAPPAMLMDVALVILGAPLAMFDGCCLVV